MSTLLAACGGGGGGGGGGEGGPAAERATRPGGPFEFAQCTAAPTALRWVRELDSGRWQTHRYVAMGSEPLARVAPVDGLPTGKNPEGVANHGPLLAQNCTPGANGQTQVMRLRLRTEDFFASEVGDHLAFGLRAFYPTANREGEEAYDGLGIILHRWWGGVLGERFRRPGGNDIGPAAGAQVPLQDGVDYLVELQATTTEVQYRVTLESTSASTGWKTYAPPAGFAPAQGTGFLIAVLCQDTNARCEAYDRPFLVDISELSVGWQ